MIYYELDGKTVNKYNIQCNINRIKELKEEIINNCSKMKHVEIEREYSFQDTYFKNKTVRNHNCENIGFNEYYDGSRSVYLHTFDLLTPPKLVNLIDRLLNDDKTVINEIFNYQEEKVSFEKEIDDKNKEIDSIDNSDVDEKIKKLNELKELLNLRNLNWYQESTKDYYTKLLNYISVEFIGSLNIDEENKVQTFFDIDLSILNGDVSILDNAKKKTK